MRNIFITLAVFVTALYLTGCTKDIKETSLSKDQSDAAINASKPNIIFILADDIGYEIPTINGGRSYSTPNIDKLANAGMRFTQCRSAPLCSPSRFMILTGKYNYRNYSVWGQMAQTEKTIGNMLKSSGYATCYAGKWQLDGGDKSIHSFGFDNYSVWSPFKQCPEDAEGSRYKSAKIYQDGGYLPNTQTINKYSDDIFTDYILNFIDSNKTKPFFAYYAMILCHKAFSPTPDDADYATWNTDPYNSDAKYFPSMVKYMDKKIGLILNKLSKLNLARNTIVIFVGDNGTQREITSRYLNKTIKGGKGKTIEYGIHVPLIIKWPGKIAPATTNADLVDFTDILPTLAGMVKAPLPTTYGPLDGTSFYPSLVGEIAKPRTSQFCYFKPNLCIEDDSRSARYAQDSIYKLYDDGRFYRFTQNVKETKPLADSTLTTKQLKIRQQLQQVLNKNQ